MDEACRGALDERGCRQIHEAALRLLSEVGCAVLDPESRDLLAAHGARVDGERVRLDERLIEQARQAAPSGFTVAGRRPELDLRVALDAPPVLASASGPPFVLVGDEYRPGRLADLRTAVALGHLSPNIQVQGFSVEPQDVPEERRPRMSAYTAITGSDKATRFTVTDLAEVKVATDIAEILYGADWHRQPRIWSIINITSPLQLSADAGQVLRRLARLGQPICVAVCAMGGTTAPVTPAGLLAQQHAELLVGLVLTQLANPGNPFIYGGTSSLSSMQSGCLMMGAPEYWALMEATVRLGHWLGVPVRAGGSLTDAHLPDAQAGIESAMAISTVLRMHVQYVLHSAGILSSFNCYSPVKFVIDDEVLTSLCVASRPIVIDEDTLALDVIAAAGPGGTVLGHRHTRRHARDTARSPIMNRAPYEVWRGLGERDLAETAAHRVVQLMEQYQPPEDLDLVVRRQLDEYCLA